MGKHGLIGAGVVFLFTAAAHAVLGGADVASPIDAAPLADDVRATAVAAWHLLTWHFAVFGGALVWSGARPNVQVPLAGWIAAVAAGDAVIFLALGIERFGRIDVMPQWVLFLLALAGLAWGGLRWRRG